MNCNLLLDKKSITCEEYLEIYKNRIIPESEKLFVREFLFPILGNEKMTLVVPQYPFIDSEGHARQIDFGIITDEGNKIAFEVNGETYHAEGIIPFAQFDDNLFRQNEILFHGWTLRRYSYNQLKDSNWRQRIFDEINLTLKKYAPELLGDIKIEPNPIQLEVLPQLKNCRELGWTKGLVIMPTGTGKTYLSAMDAYNYYLENPNAKFLFIVHRLDILTQSKNAFEDVWPNEILGLLTGETKEHVRDCRILFASKDSLCLDETLNSFSKEYFDYIIVDEVHHGEARTYRKILDYFIPKFFLGITATPDRTDKKDILALFDYQKVCEYDINDAIDRGFLVGYEYHGLKDNIDYTNIRRNGIKYNESDLERHLIINARNEMIFEKYQQFCHGDKAIGFCVTIRHAEAMAKLFNERGVSAVAITSGMNTTETKAELIKAFKNNEIAVAFTVDIFNEGIDVPNVRALLFLRPTESKTVFMQQLGRGLRISSNKDKVIILDFISNYQRANYVRQYLSTKVTTKNKEGTNAFEKNIYEYNPRCEVQFDDEVQEILDLQDAMDHEVNKDDLIVAYYDVMTEIKKKPNVDDINMYGKYKSGKYISSFGSWMKFLREIGEVTENGYHYPQGLHFGHILYILKSLYENDTTGYMNEKYIRLRGDLDKDEAIAKFQRQTKYKIQGMMGMGLIVDDRKLGHETKTIELTEDGKKLYELLKDLIDNIDLSFKDKEKGISWEMSISDFVNPIKEYLNQDYTKKKQFIKLMLNMDAVKQMFQFIYFDNRKHNISKANCYSLFFESQRTIRYCEMQGIEIPSAEASKHRVPFIVSLLEIMGFVNTTRSDIEVCKLLFSDIIFDDADNITMKQLAESYINNNRDHVEYLKEKLGLDLMKDKLEVEVL